MTRHRTAFAGLALSASVVLTGCGAVHPGQAFQVGEVTVTAAEVDEMTTGYCDALLGTVPEGQEAAVPLGLLRSDVVEALVLNEVAADVLEEQGLSIDAEFQRVSQQVESVLSETSEEVRRAVHALNYVGLASQRLAVETVGEETAQGLDPQQLEGAGRGLLWPAAIERGVEINPRYEVQIPAEGAARVDGSLSLAVSDAAKAPAESDTMTLGRSLPASQVCRS